jgi:DNA ligase-1
MQAFADLLNALVVTRGRNEKLALIVAFLRHEPDPDRGWMLAALTDGLSFPAVKSSLVRGLMAERVDPVLWALSRDYVGDTAETASLLWPEPAQPPGPPPSLSEAVDAMLRLTRISAPRGLADLLDRLDADGRYALLKLALGAMRVGVSARLAKLAFAQAFGVSVDDVEEYWHGQAPPYTPLFDWAARGLPPPDPGTTPLFRPFMLAHPLEGPAVDAVEGHFDAYVAEWKWDGIRVQLVRAGGETRVYSRGGEDISAAFPDIVGALTLPAALDGELLVRGGVQGGDGLGGSQGGAASFNALQQRLGRKTVSRRMLEEHPAFVRLYDVLSLDGIDLRSEPWSHRRGVLESLVPTLDPQRFDISQVIAADTFADLAEIRAGSRDAAIEGVMLKRRDSVYSGGRKAGLWYKWKRDPLAADCVLMYAQRGSGKRSSFYSDFTFGCWAGDPNEGADLLPVGKAYFGFTDAELKWLDQFVRRHTVNRFGPVREVEPKLVLEIGFDSLHASKRHKSGLAMRFPRILRIRSDKPAHEADRIDTLAALVT